MANAPDPLAVLAADIATSPLRLTDPVTGLEPEHYTTAGYDHLIDQAARRARATA